MMKLNALPLNVLPFNVLLMGKDEPLPAPQPLRAGPLSLVYEAGDLRTVKLGEHEILRRLYVAVRDRNWGTVPATLSNFHLQSDDASFHISYDAAHQQGDIDFAWHAEIVGEASGTIRFSMRGQARSTFLRNRIGFCALHPIRECVGRPCTVEKADGTRQSGAFPHHIAPRAPFEEMRAIEYEAAPGLHAEIRFAGDVFEMEDQRNWTDASFKTFCTPLRLPFPVEVRQGTIIEQSVTLTLKGNVPHPARAAAPLTFAFDATPCARLPRLGLGLASHGQSLGPREIERLKALNLSHLRVDLHLAEPTYEAELRRAAAEAGALGIALEAALHLSDDAAAERLSSPAAGSGARNERSCRRSGAAPCCAAVGSFEHRPVGFVNRMPAHYAVFTLGADETSFSSIVSSNVFMVLHASCKG